LGNISRALKCYYLGLAQLQEQRLPEAAKLFENVSSLVQRCLTPAAVTDSKFVDELPDFVSIDLPKLGRDAQTQTCVCRAAAILAHYRESQNVTTRLNNITLTPSVTNPATIALPLLDRLDSFETAGEAKLIDFPPTYVATPCKPILFDLALNHVQFDVEALAARTAKKGTLRFLFYYSCSL
jgi:hypothetical protein